MSRLPRQTELRDTLKQRIISGYYRFGEQLPTGLQLSEELRASYVTVNRAMKLLEKEGFVRSKHGVGHFVAYSRLPLDPTVKKVNLVNHTPATGQEGRGSWFLNEGQRQFGEAGWKVEVRMVLRDLDEVRDAIMDPEFYSVLFGFRPHLERFFEPLEHLRDRVVLVGDRADRDGIASVTSDEAQAVRLCMKHFGRFGLERATLVCANLKNEVEMQRAAGWRGIHVERGCANAWCDRHCLDMEVPAAADPAPYAARAIDRLLAEGRLDDTRALIAPDEEVAVMFSRLLMDRGFLLPDDVDIVSIGTSRLVDYYRPAIGSVDPNYAGHIRAAVEILEDRCAGRLDGPLFHSVEPRFIERRETAPAPARQAEALALASSGGG